MFNPSFLNRWVKPFYMQILHGNYAGERDEEQRERFTARVREALGDITPKIASRLIADTWRGSITGSWFAGLGGLVECRDQVGARLVASQTCFAGQAHAFAMACFADDASAEFLVEYLNIYLRQPECEYDQDWAMPALMWVDEQRGSERAQAFVAPGGLWDAFTAERSQGTWALETCRARFWLRMNYCRQHFMACQPAARAQP